MNQKTHVVDGGENVRWKVIIADDEISIHDITKMVAKKVDLDGKTIEFISVYTAEDAKRVLLEESDVALILLDVVMEEDNSGLELVRWIREDLKNPQIRIVIRTGHPGTAPENEIIYRYEINDYKEKTELNHTKLNTAIVAALRNYRDLMKLEALNAHMAIAHDELAYASMGKTRFLARLSHELRTPLNGLMVASKLLEMTPLSLEQMEYVEILRSSSDRMLPLVDEMLDVTRLEAGLYVLEEVPFSLKRLLGAIQEKYTQMALAKKINCHVLYSPDLPEFVYGDEKHLEQVISHILDNGLKFTHEGFIGIEVRKNAESESTVDLEILLTDSGIGISNEDRQRIFKPFFATQQSSTLDQHGLGLGLSIVKKLIELMKGQIWIENNYSTGVQFVVTLEMKKVVE
jgi:signal transduction histidine kinase